ncbi:MAG: hypothetical protein ACP5O8_02300 [Candidatus Aenigmatarchaeota archaeon]
MEYYELDDKEIKKVIKSYKSKGSEEYTEKEEFEVFQHLPKILKYKQEELKTPKPKTQKISVPILQKLAKDMQSNETEPLETIGTKVMGNLFDRVRFLRERIDEIKQTIREREEMNAKFNKEIDADIAEMERIITTISNREELREFKLNVTLLRMEKRKENTIFWRDMVALRKQLKELYEQYEVESKIASLFSDLNLGG